MKIAVEEKTEMAHMPWSSRLPSHGVHVVRAVPALIPAQPEESHASHISQFHSPALQKHDHSNISYLI